MDTTPRYSRQTMLAEIGPEGQERLARARVLVVGVGGLGSAASIYLAGAGIGHITLIDADTVSLSNLQRQVLYYEALVGTPKAEAAAERLSALNSEISVEGRYEWLTEANAADIVGGYDLVLDCTDNFATRYVLDDACRRAGVPWIFASIGEFKGQMALMNGPSGASYAELYPEREELCSAPKRVAGVLGAVAGVLGAMEAAQAVKYLLGFGEQLDGRLFYIDLLTFNTNTLEI